MTVQVVVDTPQTNPDHHKFQDGNSQLITGDALYAMTGIGPSELIKGEIVERMPTGYLHGRIESLIVTLINIFLRQHKLGKTFVGETGLFTSRDPDTVRAFDVAYMSNERFGQIQSRSYLDVAPELVVEVMSPDDSWTMIQEKLAEYFAAGVQVIWIVDPKLEQLHSYRAVNEIEIFQIDDTVTCEDLLPGFAMALREVFEVE